ncbi:MAG: septation protein SpoVG family protein [Elusimicrobiota bacterium]
MKRILSPRYLILLVLLISNGTLAQSGSSADGIEVTEISIDDSKATIVLNDVIEIKKIKFSKKNIHLPSRKTKSGDTLNLIRFLDPEIKEKVKQSLINRRISNKQTEKISYKITDISPYYKEDSVTKAFGKIAFNNAVEIEFRIMESRYDNENYWIAWPARPPRKGEESWKDLVVIKNKKVKDTVEQEIIKEYKSKYLSNKEMNNIEIEIKKGKIEEPVSVTDVGVNILPSGDRKRAEAEVELNYSFRINNIMVHKTEDEVFLDFPSYALESGKEIEQIKVFSTQLVDEIKRAVKTIKPSQNKSKKIEYEITNFRKHFKQSDLKYHCWVEINDSFEINCRIFDGPSYKPFVSWPSKKQKDGTYVNYIYPCNQKVKKEIESALLDKYAEVSEE